MSSAHIQHPYRVAAHARRSWVIVLAATALVLSGVLALALSRFGVDPASLLDIARARYAFAATGGALVLAALLAPPRSMPTWTWVTPCVIVTIAVAASFIAVLDNVRDHVFSSAHNPLEHAVTSPANPVTPRAPGFLIADARFGPIHTEAVYTLTGGGTYFVVDRSRVSIASVTKGWLYLPSGTPELHDIATGWNAEAIAPHWWWITTWNS